jgi:hypothetical protein
MSILDDMIDSPIEVEISGANPAPPEGKAKATLTEYGATRAVAGKDGQLYEILPCWFVVEGDQYNTLSGREMLKVKYELWIALDDNGKVDGGLREDGSAKNARMARFFKAFGKPTKGTSFGELLGGQATIGIKPEKDQNDEPTGYAKVTFVGAAK